MTIYQNLTTTIAKAKTLAISWADEFIYKESLGEDVGCGPLQMVVLTNWIGILEDYLTENFDDDGNVMTPVAPCLSQDEMLELIGKINAITC